MGNVTSGIIPDEPEACVGATGGLEVTSPLEGDKDWNSPFGMGWGEGGGESSLLGLLVS